MIEDERLSDNDVLGISLGAKMSDGYFDNGLAPKNFELPEPVKVPKTAVQHNAQFTGEIRETLLPSYRTPYRLLENVRTILMGLELTQEQGEQIIELVRTRMRKP